MSAYKDLEKRKIYQREWARKNAIKKNNGSLIVKSSPESNFIIQFHKMRKLREDNKLTAFANWTMNIRRMNEDFMGRYVKYVNRSTVVESVEPEVEKALRSFSKCLRCKDFVESGNVCRCAFYHKLPTGKCYIPLDSF
jgi:hypothetical protein